MKPMPRHREGSRHCPGRVIESETSVLSMRDQYFRGLHHEYSFASDSSE